MNARLPISISGTPTEILEKLESAKIITERRKTEGWRLFQEDEDWEYIPIYDERLCPICESFGGRMNGAQIPVEFNLWKREHPRQPLEKNEVYPNTHESFPTFGLRGVCRCLLQWVDYLFVLTRRLFNEIELAVT